MFKMRSGIDTTFSLVLIRPIFDRLNRTTPTTSPLGNHLTCSFPDHVRDFLARMVRRASWKDRKLADIAEFVSCRCFAGPDETLDWNSSTAKSRPFFRISKREMPSWVGLGAPGRIRWRLAKVAVTRHGSTNPRIHEIAVKHKRDELAYANGLIETPARLEYS